MSLQNLLGMGQLGGVHEEYYREMERQRALAHMQAMQCQLQPAFFGGSQETAAWSSSQQPEQDKLLLLLED